MDDCRRSFSTFRRTSVCTVIFRGYFRIDLAGRRFFAGIAIAVATVVDITESQLRKYLMELIGIVYIPIKFLNYLPEALIFFWFTFVKSGATLRLASVVHYTKTRILTQAER